MNSNWSHSPETPYLGPNRRIFSLGIWRMTLKNNRAPLLSYTKLYASFHHHMWIQTEVTVRKRLRRVLNRVALTFTSDIDLLHGYHSLVIGNDSWKFRDDTMTGTLWKMCNRQTDGQTDRQTDRQTDGRTDGRQTDRQTDGRTDRQKCS